MNDMHQGATQSPPHSYVIYIQRKGEVRKREKETGDSDNYSVEREKVKRSKGSKR